MAVESYFFSHDYNSRNDPKISNLRMKEGMEGVGIYWCIVEELYEEGGFVLLSECERIAYDLRVKVEKVKRVVINYLLFRNDGTKFWSESCLRRIEARNVKSGKARESALERWNKHKQDANALPPQSDSNAIKERKGKDKKGEERKGKDSYVAEATLSVWPTFDDWWTAYDKKVDRAKCEKKFQKTTQEAREKMMQHTEDYVKSTPDVQYRRNPITYLNNESWNNEIVIRNGKHSSKTEAIGGIFAGAARTYNGGNGEG